MSAMRRFAAAILYALSWCCWAVMVPIAAISCGIMFAAECLYDAAYKLGGGE